MIISERLDDAFSVTLINEKRGINKTFQVKEDEYILDLAEQEGIKIPYSCRVGVCFDCLCRVVKGEVVQTEKAMEFLRPEELEAGYVLLCAAYPRSNCTIITHQGEELFDENYNRIYIL
jgi:ferredoxin